MTFLGRLGIDSLPFYSPVAFAGAATEVLAALMILALVTWKGWWKPLFRDWIATVDHKKIGIMYLFLAGVMLLRGFADAMLMRLQQAMALNSDGYLPPEHFNQIFSAHGTIMIFFMAMPFLTGLINIVVPLQIGARDVAFPFLNAVSFWLTGAGAALVLLSLVIGKFSTAGWTAYPPFSENSFTPGPGVDYWIWAVLVAGAGSTITGINVLVTILMRRAPGMSLMRMPLFTWTALVTSILMVFAFPALTTSSAMLALDRTLGFHFFTNGDGGNMMNYANLFWIWGHPEVYILILPAFGIYSEVVATFSDKRLFGYTSLVFATAVIGVLSFTVWLHHFFTMGASANVNAVFGIATMIIAVPGVCDDGRRTTGQPAASAGASLRAGSEAGKFQAVKAPTTPTASFVISKRPPGTRLSTRRPYMRLASSAYQRNWSTASAHSRRDWAMGFPVSVESIVAASSPRASIWSAIL